MMGASTIKWTTFDPCKGLNEIISKLYINFESYGKDSTFEKLPIYKAYSEEFMLTKCN